jgi:hypothetical protein
MTHKFEGRQRRILQRGLLYEELRNSETDCKVEISLNPTDAAFSNVKSE